MTTVQLISSRVASISPVNNDNEIIAFVRFFCKGNIPFIVVPVRLHRSKFSEKEINLIREHLQPGRNQFDIPWNSVNLQENLQLSHLFSSIAIRILASLGRSCYINKRGNHVGCCDDGVYFFDYLPKMFTNVTAVPFFDEYPWLISHFIPDSCSETNNGLLESVIEISDDFKGIVTIPFNRQINGENLRFRAADVAFKMYGPKPSSGNKNISGSHPQLPYTALGCGLAAVMTADELDLSIEKCYELDCVKKIQYPGRCTGKNRGYNIEQNDNFLKWLYAAAPYVHSHICPDNIIPPDRILFYDNLSSIDNFAEGFYAFQKYVVSKLVMPSDRKQWTGIINGKKFYSWPVITQFSNSDKGKLLPVIVNAGIPVYRDLKQKNSTIDMLGYIVIDSTEFIREYVIEMYRLYRNIPLRKDIRQEILASEFLSSDTATLINGVRHCKTGIFYDPERVIYSFDAVSYFPSLIQYLIANENKDSVSGTEAFISMCKDIKSNRPKGCSLRDFIKQCLVTVWGMSKYYNEDLYTLTGHMASVVGSRVIRNIEQKLHGQNLHAMVDGFIFSKSIRDQKLSDAMFAHIVLGEDEELRKYVTFKGDAFDCLAVVNINKYCLYSSVTKKCNMVGIFKAGYPSIVSEVIEHVIKELIMPYIVSQENNLEVLIRRITDYIFNSVENNDDVIDMEQKNTLKPFILPYRNKQYYCNYSVVQQIRDQRYEGGECDINDEGGEEEKLVYDTGFGVDKLIFVEVSLIKDIPSTWAYNPFHRGPSSDILATRIINSAFHHNPSQTDYELDKEVRMMSFHTLSNACTVEEFKSRIENWSQKYPLIDFRRALINSHINKSKYVHMITESIMDFLDMCQTKENCGQEKASSVLRSNLDQLLCYPLIQKQQGHYIQDLDALKQLVVNSAVNC